MIRPEKKLLESRAESGMGLVRWLRSLGPGSDYRCAGVGSREPDGVH